LAGIGDDIIDNFPVAQILEQDWQPIFRDRFAACGKDYGFERGFCGHVFLIVF
jgi:hypothetical protein